MKYFIVTAKCGHVGRNNMIIKDFAIKAKNGKDAALRTRNVPRVLHHEKTAIINVREVSIEEYNIQYEINSNDPYFTCDSSTMQRRECPDLYLLIYKREKEETDSSFKKRSERVKTKLLKFKSDLKHYSTAEFLY